MSDEINEGWLVTEYTGQFAVTYEKAVEILDAYEFLHGTDRVAGAFRSLMSVVDNQFALKDFYKAKLAECESAIIELKPKVEEK